MSMFHGGDDRILLEEIVETSEEQEEFCCKSEIVDELCSITTNETIGEVIEVHEKHQKFQESQKNQVVSVTAASAVTCRNVGRNVLLNGNNSAGSVTRVSSHTHMEQERRMRREIANSNERRRMQSINAGFQSLRTLLPHHEGEKLSKAAILQQTAEYIYQLEQEKTQLLSQNCQLKRLINQHEGGDVPIKKRKTENQGVVVSLPVSTAQQQQHLNDDEGLGSMSPEPLSSITAAAMITVSADTHSVVSSNEILELGRQLERERQARHQLEKQLRTIQNQSMFSTVSVAATATTTTERFRTDAQLIAYQPHEVIEHTDNVIQVGLSNEEEEEEEVEEVDEESAGVASLQVVSLISLPPVGSTTTVETSVEDSSFPPSSPQSVQVVAAEEEIKEEEEVQDEEEEEEDDEEELIQDSETNSPKTVTFASQIFPSIAITVEEQQQTNSECSFSPSRVKTTYGCTESTSNSSTQYITSSPRPYSPEEDIQQRLPSVLEAAMKAEPKVEVERLPSPASSLDDGTPQARLYLANTSRQNLETIVEAIRHLEGDHLFSDEPAQDVPLALTNKPLISTTTTTSPTTTTTTLVTASSTKQRLVTNFLQFHSQQQHQQQPHQQAQQRPGVIVVKHS